MSSQTKNILEKITPEIQKDMETFWFTADLHHGHPKIIDICNRPIYLDQKIMDELKRTNINNSKYNVYDDKEYKRLINPLHNEWLVKEVINKWISKKDTIFFIGDLSLAKRVEAEKFIDRLNGNKFLIVGNHDKNLWNSTRFSQITLRKDFTYSRFGINIHIVLDHFPLASWNRKVHGSWHLYGHVHGRFKNNGLSFDVGIDNSELLTITGGIHRPLNLFEIVKIMEGKENK
jgi:calcineurin-like phosphoesterase family protein